MKRLLILGLLGVASLLSAAEVVIESPHGGTTTERIQKVEGVIRNYDNDRAWLVINGIPQTIPLQNGRFSLNTVVAPGLNTIEVQADNATDRVSFYAQVPRRDIKVVLIWDTPTDVDLWVIDPSGEKCYYAHKSTSNGGNLDVDIISGYGPETFTMTKAMPGNYAVQVQYYSSKEKPVTRVQVYLVLYEGTAREERRRFEFIMTREHQVYHLADFTIDK